LHHLIKTFWGGPGGWRDRQLPDGTVIWTSPTGHTYLTHPGSRLWFPSLCRPTGTLWHGDPPEPPPLPDEQRAAGMPRRRRPRTRDRARRIHAERRLNAADVAAELEADARARGHTLDLDDDWITRGGPPANDPPPY
jgi:hypothetical protein